jgi:histone H1/5
LAEHFDVDMSSNANVSHLNKAISRGAETGLFELPKGIGGRVKLVKKAKATAGKEVSCCHTP